jgi:hypothetical protein
VSHSRGSRWEYQQKKTANAGRKHPGAECFAGIAGGGRHSPLEKPGIPMNDLWRSCLDPLEVWVLGI